MSRNKHPDKEIEAALKHAERNDWRVEESNGHPWGQMLCSTKSTSCEGNGMWCRISIWSTPKNSHNHAQKLKKKVDSCIVFQKKLEAKLQIKVKEKSKK